MEFKGIQFYYSIDTSYKTGRWGSQTNGCVSVSEHCVVFMGLRYKPQENVQTETDSTRCILKFIKLEQKDRFLNEELPVLNALQGSPSVVRILDIIEDLGDFLQPHPHPERSREYISKEQYFCVVEELICGKTLEEYCLRFAESMDQKPLIKYTADGINYYLRNPNQGNQPIINSPFCSKKYSRSEIDDADATHEDYYFQMLYQRKICEIMLKLCDILHYISDTEHILHLDLKPEHIMITDNGENPVIIGFGRARMMREEIASQSKNGTSLPCVTIPVKRAEVYGTIGFAANGLFDPDSDQNKFTTVESDIFSFGAVFWECMNMHVLFRKNVEFAKYFLENRSVNPFYNSPYFRADNVYFERNLADASPHFHEKLEQIIQKCTRKQTDDYMRSPLFYHSYSEIRNDLLAALDQIQPKTLARSSVRICAALMGVFGAVTLLSGAALLALHAARPSLARQKIASIEQKEQAALQYHQLTAAVLDYTAILHSDDEKKAAYNDLFEFYRNDGDSLRFQEADSLLYLLRNINLIKKVQFVNDSLDRILLNICPDDLLNCLDVLKNQQAVLSYNGTGSQILNGLCALCHNDLQESYQIFREVAPSGKHDRKYTDILITYVDLLNTMENIDELAKGTDLRDIKSPTEQKKWLQRYNEISNDLNSLADMLNQEKNR